MEFRPVSRIINHKQLTKGGASDLVTVQVAVIADQEWEQIEKMDEKLRTCDTKRKMAQQVVDVKVPTDGRWSYEVILEEKKEQLPQGKVTTQNRPRMYYFEVLDCDKTINSVFR